MRCLPLVGPGAFRKKDQEMPLGIDKTSPLMEAVTARVCEIIKHFYSEMFQRSLL
jgi:hypothetical protein